MWLFSDGADIWLLSKPNLTIFEASESDFLESNTYLTLFESDFSVNFMKISRYSKKISDFLGIRIRLFVILKVSDPIRIRLFGNPLHHQLQNERNTQYLG